MPLPFTKNMGQWPDSILFRTDAGCATVWFTKTGLIYQFTRKIERVGAETLEADTTALPDRYAIDRRDSLETMLVRATFVGSNPNAEIVGEGLMDYKCNYFIGNDPSKWRSDVPNYSAITLHNVYDGVNLRFSGGTGGGLTYEYALKPGADMEQVKLAYDGVAETKTDAAGEIVASIEWGTVSGLLASPVDCESSVPGNVALLESAIPSSIKYGMTDFLNPEADGLIYSTFLGGLGFDAGDAIAVDGSGCAYVTGITYSSSFPAQSAYDANLGEPYDVFVTKFSSAGNTLVYSTYLGGSEADWGRSIDVDGSGCAYVTGYTSSSSFPTKNAFDASHNGGSLYYPMDVFLTKISAMGNELVYSTFLGGSDDEYGWCIVVDAFDCAYVTGYTHSSGFPMQSAYDAVFNGGDYDVFVTKFSAAGNSLVYSTYLGGSSYDRGDAIAVDGSGCAYVAGRTHSSNYPTHNAYDADHDGMSDAFVTKLSALGNTLSYSTFIGGSGEEVGSGIAVDSYGCAYVLGWTVSADFPTQSAYDASYAGAWDVFVAKLATAGNTLTYSSYLGGLGSDLGEGIAVDESGCAHVVGYTSSTDFPVLNATDPGHNGGLHDVFVTKFSAGGSSLSYSTFLGGSGWDEGSGIAVGGSESVYVTGQTSSLDFPTRNAYDATYNGGDRDVFVTVLGPGGGLPESPTYQSRFTITIGSPASLQVIGCTDDTYSTDCYGRTGVLWSGNCQPPSCATLTGTGVIPAGVRKLMFYWWEQGSMLFPGYAIGAIRYEDGGWKVVNLSAWANLYIQAKSGQGELLVPQVADTSASGEDLYTLIILEDWLGSGQPIQDTYSVVDGTCGEIPGLLVSTTPIQFDSLAGPGDDPFLGTPYTGTVHLIAETSLSPGCCLEPSVGDIDQSGVVDITDIQLLVDNQFLSLTPLLCEAEGDIDFSGAVDITDLSILIDNQFLTLTPLPPCP